MFHPVPQAKEEEERRAAEAVALKASLAAGDKLEPPAAEQLMRYLLEEADGSAAKVRGRGGCGWLHALPCWLCSNVQHTFPASRVVWVVAYVGGCIPSWLCSGQCSPPALDHTDYISVLL